MPIIIQSSLAIELKSGRRFDLITMIFEKVKYEAVVMQSQYNI
jgi:hypothetical protein